jgi:type I restriction enzyme M protein
MAVKKSELYSSLWASYDSLRGGMDSSQYKDYILTLLFVKYVSDKFKGVTYDKSKGQFYTPAEVSRILAKVVGIEHATNRDTTLYDPACGSGSLLIRAAEAAPVDVAIYGQEKEITTAGLARMNLVLHNRATAEIKGGYRTFSDPQYMNQADDSAIRQFDFAVVNPPFSDKNWTHGLKEYSRFDGYGDRPPQKNGDFAWLLHIIKSLKRKGKAAVILPHGVLFRGNAEAAIRRSLIDLGYIKGIIGLPANLFYGAGIPACVIVILKRIPMSEMAFL